MRASAISTVKYFKPIIKFFTNNIQSILNRTYVYFVKNFLINFKIIPCHFVSTKTNKNIIYKLLNSHLPHHIIYIYTVNVILNMGIGTCYSNYICFCTLNLRFVCDVCRCLPRRQVLHYFVSTSQVQSFVFPFYM